MTAVNVAKHAEPQALAAPWTLRSWPPLLWQAGCTGRLRLAHLSTRVLHPGDGHGPGCGQTLWGGPIDEGEAGLAWDWVQLSRGVVAMADPMCVITNLRLLGPAGEVLTAFETARHLNELVCALPWQTEVRRALQVGHA